MDNDELRLRFHDMVNQIAKARLAVDASERIYKPRELTLSRIKHHVKVLRNQCEILMEKLGGEDAP